MSNHRIKEYLLPETARTERLDKVLARLMDNEGVSRERIKSLIAGGAVTVNGQTVTLPRQPVSGGARIRVQIAQGQGTVEARPGELEILYRDDALAVVNKAAGLTVHPCPSCRETTLVHRLLAHFPELAAMEGERPGIVHRLDKDTSGLMIVALNEASRLRLAADFAGREISKEYLALVTGVPDEPEDDILLPVGRDPVSKVKMAVVPVERGGREARSRYRVLYSDPAARFCLVAVRIFTGRTHQIRVHMAALGHPLLGDNTYGHKATSHAERQMLHAWKLALTHPISGRVLSFCQGPPDDFISAACSASRSLTRLVLTGAPGCGKSAALAAFSRAGYPTWSADAIVRGLYRKGADGWLHLRGRYGERFVPDEEGDVDKTALTAAMRQEPSLRREVEALIHPLVRADLHQFWQRQANVHETGNAPWLAVAEVPLYLETGWRKDAGQADSADGTPPPLILGVWCPDSVRHVRLRERGWDTATIADMESWQWSNPDKMRAADLILDNSGDLDDLERRTLATVHILQGIRGHREKRLALTLRELWAC